MKRRTALKIFGALFVCLAGRVAVRAEESQSIGESKLKLSGKPGPMDYTFSEEGIGNIIIECKDGSNITVPFSDIVEALKGK